MGFNVTDFTSGNAIKADWLKVHGPCKGMIADTRVTEFKAKDGGKPERKPELVIDLGDEERTLVLNKTNLNMIAAFYGPNSDAWVGKPVIAYHDPSVSYGGKLIGGVKVKIPKNQGTPASAPAEREPGSDDVDDDFPL